MPAITDSQRSRFHHRSNDPSECSSCCAGRRGGCIAGIPCASTTSRTRRSLRPKTIRSEGLLASVLKLVDQFGRLNLIETNVSIRGEEATIAAEHKEVIFQVLRESLSNIRKHSQARNLWVVLDLSSTPWVLTVRDDGRGFELRRVADDSKKAGSYGLVGMRERADLLGGALEIVSQPFEGTLITLIGPPERLE